MEVRGDEERKIGRGRWGEEREGREKRERKE